MAARKKFAELIQRQRWLKMVPNTLTLCNSICGFVAIVYMLQVYDETTSRMLAVFATSSWIVVCAMIFDVLDGFAARIFHAASLHGMQMDSLSDMVTFGVAPATICAIMTHVLRNTNGVPNVVTYLLCAIYLGCAALRLATYNVHALSDQKGSDRFSGLPSPGAAAGVCSMAMLLNWFSVNYGDGFAFHRLAVYIPWYAAALGLLMVSPISYPHAGKWFFTVHRSKRRLLLVVLALSAVIVFHTPALFVMVNLYIFIGPVAALIRVAGRGRRSGACAA
ncbi:MAG: CDP-alcohol phosphatidyltransferase family protein [Victivallaceae bacterium]|nr:CDP-alcohol phosphatidyltransferase family protein [Victivallaceae bacterium]